MKLPGTSPPNVQNTYSTPSARRFVTSLTSTFTMTLAGFFRVIGGGTVGACVSTAVSTPGTSGSTSFAPVDGAAGLFFPGGNRPGGQGVKTGGQDRTARGS